MARLSLDGVSRQFGARTAVDRVSLTLEPGTFLALLGPSGCGKTTLLRLIAGFDRPDGGTITLGDGIVASDTAFVPPERRGVGMVFQSYALWPHMTVAENVAYALKIRGVARAERARIVQRCLDQVGLGTLGGRLPAALSGGQRQRVALARCLAMNPAILLLDEPLANLDAHLRESMQREFRAFHAKTGATMVYVTHDQAEALSLADKVAVMDGGVLQQVATPAELYRRPATDMVARFVGRGMVLPAHLGRATAGGGAVAATLFGQAISVDSPAHPAGPARLCLRSEDLSLTGPDTPEGLGCTVCDTVFHGDHFALDVRPQAAPETVLRVRLTQAPPPQGSPVTLRIGGGWILPLANGGC
ncbi:ABC transporter ATP-binding protein [Rhodospirillum rubrum]|uniref:ABC transporter component n=1 Tax=Rhodospirillum rubrum (strain ATCC 11170 / ATH 1.1.1 / DSM 467 / LMG 4362 / NCIMB 8255 / S1) TaxID=269796 RepID=Q2RPE9_RHORT|nr:ABC transporter ATP-binding protein [Rhodospirillum rubrum]ABC23996.1 ABC transporter component [Rhodospirillum rubrum ATCC 11170]AEO49740.1 ABC transporter protein [Rhodospirillum rubrum F11]MBK5955680.1 ABC transporter ATP-binding protein [Rhodospirillum rubrum]QXG79938.1 ABC transporter ATP-binding protein [Rhodospirillum rubrum]HAQ01441.1 ABC transporter ATP-binding protein [Rhodospirillum rubrum]